MTQMTQIKQTDVVMMPFQIILSASSASSADTFLYGRAGPGSFPQMSQMTQIKQIKQIKQTDVVMMPFQIILSASSADTFLYGWAGPGRFPQMTQIGFNRFGLRSMLFDLSTFHAQAFSSGRSVRRRVDGRVKPGHDSFVAWVPGRARP